MTTHAVDTWVTRGLNQQVNDPLVEGRVFLGQLRNGVLNTRDNPFARQQRMCCEAVVSKEGLDGAGCIPEPAVKRPGMSLKKVPCSLGAARTQGRLNGGVHHLWRLYDGERHTGASA